MDVRDAEIADRLSRDAAAGGYRRIAAMHARRADAIRRFVAAERDRHDDA